MMRGRGLAPTNLTWLMDCADLPPSDQDLGAFAEYGTFIGPDKVRNHLFTPSHSAEQQVSQSNSQVSAWRVTYMAVVASGWLRWADSQPAANLHLLTLCMLQHAVFGL